ncbi:phage tail-collar fiber domain-containing protein [Undibacterium crateris]|uniref:phage tail-collar fiber domain-containing protein n=1 Tax=Undibacterium crateris TaxID=2528175 RepID=UPI001389A4BC|nr:phage tail protein [Undibacterium crateris]NDI85082.1 hypothetical protein [Undibacterium crateris]
MSNSIPLQPAITQAGLAATKTANGLGVSLAITHISFGTGQYNPSGKEVALQNEIKRSPVSGGGSVSATQIQVHAEVAASENAAFWCGEIGFWAGNTLFAVFSSANKNIMFIADKVTTMVSYAINLSVLPANAVTVTVDSSISIAQSLVGAHESAQNPHPQYLKYKGEYARRDADSVVSPGYYLERYDGASSTSLIIDSGGSTGAVQQRFEYDGGMLYRNKRDSTNWTEWKAVWHSGNLRNVSQLANDAGYAKKVSPTFTGTVATIGGETLRSIGDLSFLSFWNSANDARVGYLQGIAGSRVQLMAESGHILALGANGKTPLVVNNSGNVTVNTSDNGIDSLQVGGDISLSGAVKLSALASSDFVRIPVPEGAADRSQVASATGAIQILMPVGYLNSMLIMRVKIYDYTSSGYYELGIAGYAYAGSNENTWLNCAASLISAGKVKSFNVRFGNVAGKLAIWIGELASTFGYPNVEVSEVFVGHTGQSASFVKGWSVSSGVTSFGQVQVITRTASNAANAFSLNGAVESEAPTNGSIAKRTAEGYLQANRLHTTQLDENHGVSSVYTNNGVDGYLRRNSIADFTSKLSGTAPIAITGNAGTATSARYATVTDGARDANAILPNGQAYSTRWDFVTATSASMGGYYAGVMTVSPFQGASIGGGGASYQLAFGGTGHDGFGLPQMKIRKGIDTVWNSWYELWHSGNLRNVSQLLNDVGYRTTAATFIDISSIDSAIAPGEYVVDMHGYSTGMTVFVSGGSTGIVQQVFTHGGGMQFRNKTDSASWTPWKTVWTNENLKNNSQLANDSGYITASGSAARARGLQRSDTAPDAFNVQSWWDGTNWYLKGFNDTIFHAGVRVAVADAATALGGLARTNGTDGWFRSTGNAGWFSESYNVGIYAIEPGTIRTYGGANFHAAGYVAGTNLTSATQALNLDVTKPSGLYHYDGAITGTKPPFASGNYRTIEIGYGTRYTQVAFPWNDDSMYFRRQQDTWKPWVKVTTDIQVPIVSKRTRYHSDDGTSINSAFSEHGFDYNTAGSGVTGAFFNFGQLGALGNNGASNYQCQMVSAYGDPAGVLKFRTQNGDVGAWNPWRTIWHDGNLTLTTTGLPLSVLQLDSSGTANMRSLWLNQTDGVGAGVYLYPSVATTGSYSQPSYGIMFAQTGSFGTYGAVNNDWATYFTMTSDPGRGWIFRNVGNGGKNVASISNTGAASFDGTVSSSATEALRLRNDNAFVAFVNDDGTRNGYIQYMKGSYAQFMQENGIGMRWGTAGQAWMTLTPSGRLLLGGNDNGVDKMQVAGSLSASGGYRGTWLIPDVRANAATPNNYQNFAATIEFKESNKVDNPPISANNNYSYILTVVGYESSGSAGGGTPVQVSFGDGLSVRQANNGSSWGAWRKLWHDGNLNKLSQLTNDMGIFPSGTRMPFAQSSAPTGWVQDVSDKSDNRLLRVVNWVGGNVGGVHNPVINNVVPAHTHGFTTGWQSSDHNHWLNDPGHAHAPARGGSFVTQMPNYSGDINGVGGGNATYNGGGTTAATATGMTMNGISASHSHTGGTDNGSSQTNWEPRYIDMIICVKV